MFLHILTLAFALQSQPASADDINDTLTRAEALYYEARFGDSVTLLLRANELLQTRSDRMQDRIRVKQQLALSYIGMNNMAAAKTLLIEIYGLDPNYSLDPQQFSPKVISLAADAKNEYGKVRCVAAGTSARRNLESGNTTALLDILRTERPRCSELASLEPAAAELFYKKGVAEYRRSEFTEASRSLQVALQFAPAHELAAQYLEVSQGKLQIMEERILLQWQKEFETKQYAQAAANYRQMASMREVEAAAGRAKAEYRNALTNLVDTWNRTCPTGNRDRMEEIRKQISDMLPEPSFGEDIRSRMMPCSKSASLPEPPVPVTQLVSQSATNVVAKPPAAAEAKNARKPGCLQMDIAAAMTRLKVRVEPDFPREARAFMQNSRMNLNIKVRIDETGNVTVNDIQGGNPAINAPVKTAVERWKFSPALDPTGTRCVDTEMPMTIGK